MPPHTSHKVIMRFWSHVAPPDENGCRLWRGPYQDHNSLTEQDKVGAFAYTKDSIERISAHRFAYKMYHPELDIDNLFVLHIPTPLPTSGGLSLPDGGGVFRLVTPGATPHPSCQDGM